MWIRSQDKKILTEIHDVEIDSGFKVWGSGSLIGEYSTQEKAIKVLDMIQEKIIERELMNFGLVKRFSYEHCAFQMPQDDEVKENE